MKSNKAAKIEFDINPEFIKSQFKGFFELEKRIKKLLEEKKMKQMHMTAGGKVMEINEMDDAHLLNTINLNLKKLAEAKRILDGEATKGNFTKVFFGHKFNVEQVEAFVMKFDSNFSAYIFEGWVRGFDMSAQLSQYKEITGRTGAQSTKTEYFFDTTDENFMKKLASYRYNDLDQEDEF